MAKKIQTNRIHIDEYSKFAFLIVLLSQYFLLNGQYLFSCLAVLLILLYNLTQPYKPGVFSIIVVHHILQIIAGVLQANYLGTDIDTRTAYISTATIASLIGMLFLFFPIVFYQSKIQNYQLSDLKEFANKLSTQNVFTCYVVSFFGCSALGGIAFLLPGLTQIIISFIKIKWLFFILFGYLSILKKEYRKLFYLTILVEVGLGFYSFFSDFKTVIYFVLVLLISLVPRLNIKQIFVGVVVGTLLISFGILWTSVKTDYRQFLNGGNSTQAVTVSSNEAFDKLFDLSNNLDKDNLDQATLTMLDRLQYTYHFAKAINMVPDRIPFQNGNNWKEVIEFTTTPRFLNPDKPTLDNSVKTSKYTGIRYLGKEKGVSFSLGYFAEFYIDFGFIGMMLGLALLGLFYGKIYNYFTTKATENPLVNYAIACSFFFEFYAYEMDGTYLTGRLFSSLVTYYLLIRFFSKGLIEFITKKYDEDDKD